jgi:hypothetical protein
MPNIDKYCKQLEFSYIADGKWKMIQLLCETFWRFFMLNMRLLYDPAILPIVFTRLKWKLMLDTKTFTWILIAALFVI